MNAGLEKSATALPGSGEENWFLVPPSVLACFFCLSLTGEQAQPAKV
jgi:hypothetical protein